MTRAWLLAAWTAVAATTAASLALLALGRRLSNWGNPT